MIVLSEQDFGPTKNPKSAWHLSSKKPVLSPCCKRTASQQLHLHVVSCTSKVHLMLPNRGDFPPHSTDSVLKLATVRRQLTI